MNSENKKLQILLTYASNFPSVQLCAYAQLQELASQGLVDYRAMSYHKVSRKDLNWADVVIMGRSDSWYERKLATKAYNAGKTIAYLIDDDLLNVPGNLLSAVHFSRKDIRQNIEDMISLSQMVLSPSPVLLDRYAPEGSGRKGILVEEPAVLPAEFAPREDVLPVRIGFAGSLDRVDDIENILKDALLRIKQEYANQVSFHFFGAIPSFAQALDAQTVPFCDCYETYLQTLNGLQWDIGLAPMPDTAFHGCKHYIKFIEYSSACMVGIFSETGPYLRLKKWPDTCVFCENTADSWYQAIKKLLDDPKLREAMRHRAHCVCQKELNVQTVAADFYSQLQTCVTSSKETGKVHFLRLPNKIAFFLVRTYYFLLNHRHGLFAAVKRKLKREK